MLFPILSIHISDIRSNKHHFMKGLNKQSNWNGLRYMFQFANIFNYSKISIYRLNVYKGKKMFEMKNYNYFTKEIDLGITRYIVVRIYRNT
ncbi:unnamed protein product [Rhizophagus irregularis]|nr:unnamed protein product [Rhizophagus irregularis]